MVETLAGLRHERPASDEIVALASSRCIRAADALGAECEAPPVGRTCRCGSCSSIRLSH